MADEYLKGIMKKVPKITDLGPSARAMTDPLPRTKNEEELIAKIEELKASLSLAHNMLTDMALERLKGMSYITDRRQPCWHDWKDWKAKNLKCRNCGYEPTIMGERRSYEPDSQGEGSIPKEGE